MRARSETRARMRGPLTLRACEIGLLPLHGVAACACQDRAVEVGHREDRAGEVGGGEQRAAEAGIAAGRVGEARAFEHSAFEACLDETCIPEVRAGKRRAGELAQRQIASGKRWRLRSASRKSVWASAVPENTAPVREALRAVKRVRSASLEFVSSNVQSTASQRNTRAASKRTPDRLHVSNKLPPNCALDNIARVNVVRRKLARPPCACFSRCSVLDACRARRICWASLRLAEPGLTTPL